MKYENSSNEWKNVKKNGKNLTEKAPYSPFLSSGKVNFSKELFNKEDNRRVTD